MTTFKLEKQTPGKTSTRFHVLDSAGAICGIVTVQNEDVSDFQNHWKSVPQPSSPKTAASNTGKQVSAMIKAGRKPSKEAVLRGC